MSINWEKKITKFFLFKITKKKVKDKNKNKNKEDDLNSTFNSTFEGIQLSKVFILTQEILYISTYISLVGGNIWFSCH